MSMIKRLQESLAQAQTIEQLNKKAIKEQVQGGGLMYDLEQLAAEVDEIHTKFAHIVKANQDEYNKARDLGVPNYDSTVRNNVNQLVRTLQEMINEVAEVQ